MSKIRVKTDKGKDFCKLCSLAHPGHTIAYRPLIFFFDMLACFFIIYQFMSIFSRCGSKLGKCKSNNKTLASLKRKSIVKVRACLQSMI